MLRQSEGPSESVPAVGRPAFRSSLFASTFRALDQARRARMPSSLSKLLGLVRGALGKDDLAEALRLIDRAWRLGTSKNEALATVYGRLLCLEGLDYDAARRMLQHVTRPDD